MSAPVWQDLDQSALDRAYDQTQWAPNWAQVLQRYAQRSEQLRERLGPPVRLAYGSGANEALDLHGAGDGLAPVLVYVHGGAWRSGRAEDYAFLAEPFVRAGARVILPDFDAVQDCGGDLGVLADQVQRALAAVVTQAQAWGIDPTRIHLAGHSSGAHLAAVCATAGQGLPLASLLCCSGMYELEPVRRSARSRYVHLDDAAVQMLSPARHASALTAPVLVAVGSCESPQFIWQSQMWTQTLVAAGLSTSALWAEGLNHFEILETLAEPGSALARLQLRRMGLDA
ncbi:MAG: alpha/beta hydrolase [Betaproteobacteria bacterium]